MINWNIARTPRMVIGVTTPGRILRRSALGTEATYRVVEEDGQRVLVEVISAPGLKPGFRLHLSADTANEMQREAGTGRRRD